VIVFDLHCANSDRFEAWFRSTADFERQLEQSLVQCPVCGSSEVAKAPMAPRIPARSNRSAGVEVAIAELASLQAKMLSGSRWVGDRFAETARAMHLGETETAQVHGEATAEQARSLVEDGIPVAPLPLPVVPPSQVN
jgi:hypothetical protein